MVVRATGAFYLIYIGYMMLRVSFASRAVGDHISDIRNLQSEEPPYAAYLQGLLTNLGNPTMIVLLTSFFPQFVAEASRVVRCYLSGLGCLLILQSAS